MKKTVLLTRPRQASERWAALLAQHGFDSVIEPLLVIEPTGAPRPAALFQAVLITSANAPDILSAVPEALAGLLALPCFCVGEATGAAARSVGFTDIHCGASDSAEMARTIIATLKDKTFPLLHIAGEEVDGKARKILTEKGFTLTSWAVYRARAAQSLSEETCLALARGDIGCIPVFSPRSARTLVSLIEKNNLVSACSCVTAVGLSQAIADVLQPVPWLELRVAAKPEEDEVLSCLQSEDFMTDIQDTPTPSVSDSAPQNGAKKNHHALRWTMGGVLLIALGAVGAVYCPWRPMMNVPVVNDGALEALTKRVAALEARPVATSEPMAAVVAPSNATEIAALNDKVKALETQIAQIENKGSQEQQAVQDKIAASFAYFDLRQAIGDGRSFAPQLAALRLATKGDAAIAELCGKLDSFAEVQPLTLPQLQEALVREEKNLAEPVAADEVQTVWARVKAAFRPLISVRPMHDARLAEVEKALGAKDAAAALAAVKALSPEIQKSLAAWQGKLEARVGLDETLRALAVHFTALGAQGSNS